MIRRLCAFRIGGPWRYAEPEGGGDRRGCRLDRGNVRAKSLELEHIGVRQSPYATFIDYRVKR
jgi:hypothetical protein